MTTATAATTQADTKVLMLDTQKHADCAEYLRKWLGEEGAHQALEALSQSGQRYVFIASFDGGPQTDPRYLHTLDFLPDFTALLDRMLSLLFVTERDGGGRGLDLYYRLAPVERDFINHALDQRKETYLRKAQARGPP